jgi:hypothetical protein
MPTACALVLAAVLTATASPSPGREADADLDGDGKRERVTLSETKPGAFRLSAGKVLIEGELPGVRGFTVVDVDSGDKRREVLVHGEADGTARFRLFRHTGSALQDVPLPPGRPSASGNGILLCDVPMADGWARRDKYLYDAKTPGFSEVPQELYAVGLVLKTPRHVVLQRTPGSDEAVASAGLGRSLSLLAFKKDAGDQEGGWYLTGVVDAPGDVLGWLPASSLRKAASDSASEAAPSIPKPVPPELYASGQKPRVATSFPLLRTRGDDADTVAKLRAGSTVTLLATDGAWYLVQSETGLLGWARPGTLAQSVEVTKKAGVPDPRAQLLALQLRLRGAMPLAPDAREPWLPSGSGLILENEYASTMDTYNLCPDGRVVMEFLVDDFKKYGTWTLDGDTLKLELTRETKKLGIGEPLYPPEGQEGLPQYSEYRPYEGTIAETGTLSWSEVLEDVKGDSPSYTPKRGTPTCR